MLLINLYGGPGSGKSTTAYGVAHELKSRGVNAELITEYAKDKVWDNSTDMLDNQFYISAKQYHRQWRLMNNVDIAVTDSPLLLSLYYNTAYNTESITARDGIRQPFEDLIFGLFNAFDNMNFFINRIKPYNQSGRVQDEVTAKVIDNEIKNLLNAYKVEYESIDGNKLAHIVIASLAIERLGE